MSEWWEKERYLYGRELEGGTWVCVAQMIHTWRIMLCDPMSVFEFWCYPNDEFSPLQVIAWAQEFSGEGDPHWGWVKHHPSHRRPRQVVMLDLDDSVLHFPGSVHLVTRCGVPVEHATVGPMSFVEPRAESQCARCFGYL